MSLSTLGNLYTFHTADLDNANWQKFENFNQIQGSILHTINNLMSVDQQIRFRFTTMPLDILIGNEVVQYILSFLHWNDSYHFKLVSKAFASCLKRIQKILLQDYVQMWSYLGLTGNPSQGPSSFAFYLQGAKYTWQNLRLTPKNFANSFKTGSGRTQRILLKKFNPVGIDLLAAQFFEKYNIQFTLRGMIDDEDLDETIIVKKLIEFACTGMTMGYEKDNIYTSHILYDDENNYRDYLYIINKPRHVFTMVSNHRSLIPHGEPMYLIYKIRNPWLAVVLSSNFYSSEQETEQESEQESELVQHSEESELVQNSEASDESEATDESNTSNNNPEQEGNQSQASNHNSNSSDEKRDEAQSDCSPDIVILNNNSPDIVILNN